MPRLIVYLLFNLIFSNLVFAKDKNSNYSCRWDNQNKIPCIEIISLIPNTSNFSKSGINKTIITKKQIIQVLLHQEHDALMESNSRAGFSRFSGFASCDERSNTHSGVGTASDQQHEHGARGIGVFIAHEESSASNRTQQAEGRSDVHPKFSLFGHSHDHHASKRKWCAEHAWDVRGKRCGI